MIEGILAGLTTALTPTNLLMVMVGCFAGTFIGMLPGLGPISAIALDDPDHLRLRPGFGHDSHGRCLLRRNLRRLHLLDPDQRAGGGRHRGHLLRRLSHGAGRPRRQGPGDCRLRLLQRRHYRGDLPADRRPGAGHRGAFLPIGRLLRAHGARPDRGLGLRRARPVPQGHAHGLPRPRPGDHRPGHLLRHHPLHLRLDRPARRHLLPPAGHGRLRAFRGPAHQCSSATRSQRRRSRRRPARWARSRSAARRPRPWRR